MSRISGGKNKHKMGAYYWLVNHTDKVYLDLEGGKICEQHTDFDRRLIQGFVEYYCVHNQVTLEYVSDEAGGWDKYGKQYKEVTCDILVSIFGDDYVPNRWQFGFIYDKFKENNRLEELGKWMKTWDEKEKKRKE